MHPSLIIKPTELCNWRCTFCSSTDIQKEGPNLDIDYIRQYVRRFPQTPAIIVNGGDPLMMRPQYYWEILKVLQEEGCPAVLAFTTNLWAFYKKPDLWTPLFKHHKVTVSTSFQYGDARLKGDYTPYTEEEFWKVSNLFLERVGYRPPFIAVITKENEDTAIKTVELAKAMDVVCKVNYAVASGPKKTTFKGITIGSADETYVLADIYKRYVQIIEAGLADWEHNAQVLKTRLSGGWSICPQYRECDDKIRVLQPGGKYYSCGAFGDDGLYAIDFEKEMAGELFKPLQSDPDIQYLKTSCPACPMFEICNGCKKTIHDLKRLELVEDHCSKMKELTPKIIEINSLTGRLIPTPYEKEYDYAQSGT